MSTEHFDLADKRILVTGGTGFIGGRLVEKLVLQYKAKVRVLVRNFAGASRIARFPIRMIRGDLTESVEVEQAVDGCDVIFHCAYGNRGNNELRRLVNVEGTRNLLEAALHKEVKRVVHVSTVAVYGITPDGDFDETFPRRYTGNVYADSKLDAEKIALSYAEKYGLGVSIIQPTVVYGPFAPVWTVGVLQQLKAGRMILINGGEGLCNAVYVDDVIKAMILAAEKDGAVGKSFLISSDRPVTWSDYYSSYGRMLGSFQTVSMSPDEAMTFFSKAIGGDNRKSVFVEAFRMLREEQLVRERISRTLEVTVLKRLARSLLPEKSRQSLRQRFDKGAGDDRQLFTANCEKPILALDPLSIKFYASKSRARIDKAKRVLGYEPAFNLEQGMKLTEYWAKWANLLE